MTESLHSDDSISAQESQLIKVLIDDLLYLKAFALRDGNAGSYAITGADAALFQFDILGNVEAAGTLLFDDREDPVYRFNVEYTESLANGGQTFRAEISLRLTETYNSTANLSVVEGSNITIDIERLTGSNTYSKGTQEAHSHLLERTPQILTLIRIQEQLPQSTTGYSV